MPSDHPGRAEGVLRADARAHGERHRADVRRTRRPRAPAPRPGRPSRPRPSRRRRRARSRSASRRGEAPSVTVCRVAARRPPTTWSSCRVEREPHRPAGRARELGGEERLDAGALLAAEAAADVLGDHAHTLAGSPKRRESSRRASKMPWVETHAVSSSPSQRATAACGSSGRLHVRGRLAGELDPHLGGRERRVGLAAHALERLVREALLRRGPSRRRSGATRLVARGPARRARPRPPAACRRRRRRPARPAHAGSAVSDGSPLIVNGPSGPSTARTPGVARAASRSSDVTRQRAVGARSTRAWSMPGSATSTVYRAAPLARDGPSWRGAGRPTTLSSASSGQISRSSSSSTSAQTSSKRPSISRWVLTNRFVTRPPGPTRARIARSIFG